MFPFNGHGLGVHLPAVYVCFAWVTMFFAAVAWGGVFCMGWRGCCCCCRGVFFNGWCYPQQSAVFFARVGAGVLLVPTIKEQICITVFLGETSMFPCFS